MKMFRRKNQPYQPSRHKLDLAISAILDQAINVDSDKAPQQLRLVLLKENPMWKLPERRVARYLKRHLKARQSPKADEIDADMDEQTVYTTVSTNTITKDSTPPPAIVNNTSIPENTVPEGNLNGIPNETDDDGDAGGAVSKADEGVENKAGDTIKDEGVDENEEKTDKVGDEPTLDSIKDDVVAVDSKSRTMDGTPDEDTGKSQEDEKEIYADDNVGVQDEGIVCFGQVCVIS
jgi:hypothetical protein